PAQVPGRRWLAEASGICAGAGGAPGLEVPEVLPQAHGERILMTAPYAHLLGERRLLPVILGGDIGGYSLARAFHEAFGVKSIIMSVALGGVVRDSMIVHNVVEPKMDTPEVAVAALQRIADENPDASLIALASAD